MMLAGINSWAYSLNIMLRDTVVVRIIPNLGPFERGVKGENHELPCAAPTAPFYYKNPILAGVQRSYAPAESIKGLKGTSLNLVLI